MIYRRFFLVTASAFFIRAVFLITVGTNPKMYLTPDSPAYLRLAENLLTHHQFSTSRLPPLEPDTIRTPGYPLFLIPFVSGENSKILLIVWTQALLGALTAGFLFLVGFILWQKMVAATFTGFAMGFDYVIILYSSFIMTEPLYLLLFVLSLLFFARFLINPSTYKMNLALAAFFSGLCTLVRPVSLYYFLIPLSVLVYRGLARDLKNTAKLFSLYFLVSIALPFFWMARNKTVIGGWTISTIQGLTRASILEEYLSHKTYEEADAALENRFKLEHPDGFPNPGKEAAAKSVWALKYTLHYPQDYAVVLLHESIRLIAGNGMKAGAWMFFKDPRHDPFTIMVHPTDTNQTQVKNLSSNHPILGVALVVYLSLLALVYVLSLVGFLVSWREMKPAALWLGLTTVYFFLVSIGFGSGARYRIPLMPGIFLLAGLGVDRVWGFISSFRTARRSS